MKHPDFHHIEPHQMAVHDRLRNWARWVSVRPQRMVHPMFRMYRPAQHWDPKEFREPCDLIDAQRVEKIVGGLPKPHAYALRWAYIYRFLPSTASKALSVNQHGLYRYVRDGRQMVLNLVD